MKRLHGGIHLFFVGLLAATLMNAPAVAEGDQVDDILSKNLGWRTTNQVSKSKLRLVGGDGAPVGWYYLDLRSSSRCQASIMNYNLGAADLVVRTVRMPNQAYMFFNEDAYLSLDQATLLALDGSDLDFWAASTVGDARAALGAVLTITGATSKTVEGVVYEGIQMSLSAEDWDVYRASIDSTLVVNMPQATVTQVVLFFAQSGELHSIETTGGGVSTELLFYDWTNLAGNLDGIDDARRAPHTGQNRWDMPIDEAVVRYIARIAQ